MVYVKRQYIRLLKKITIQSYYIIHKRKNNKSQKGTK